MSSFQVPVDPAGLVYLAAIRSAIAAQGEALQYQCGGGAGELVALTGVWCEGSDVAAGAPGALARVRLCLPDMPADPAKGDLVLHNGLTYTVMDAKVDGHGSVWLWLRSA